MLTLCYQKSFQQKSKFRFKNYGNAGFEAPPHRTIAANKVKNSFEEPSQPRLQDLIIAVFEGKVPKRSIALM